MDSASPKRKPGSGLTRGACYVWLQRPAPLGFSVPVNAAPFISLRFHGKVQSAQQVAVSPGGEGSARGPSRSRSTLGAEACSRVPAAVGGRPLTAPGHSAGSSLSPGLPLSGSQATSSTSLPPPPQPGCSHFCLHWLQTSHLPCSDSLGPCIFPPHPTQFGGARRAAGPLQGGHSLGLSAAEEPPPPPTRSGTLLSGGPSSCLHGQCKAQGLPARGECPSGENAVFRRNGFAAGREQILIKFPS